MISNKENTVMRSLACPPCKFYQRFQEPKKKLRILTVLSYVSVSLNSLVYPRQDTLKGSTLSSWQPVVTDINNFFV